MKPAAVQRIGPAGIPVFLDRKDALLDMLKLTETDPRKVIMAVGVSVAVNVMRTYAKKHAPRLAAEFDKFQNPVLFNFGKGKSPLRLAAHLTRKGT